MRHALAAGHPQFQLPAFGFSAFSLPMANIHIARNQQSLGSFGEAEVAEGLRTGRFSPTDLAWREGMPAWKPLGEMAPQWGLETVALTESTPIETPPALASLEVGPAWEEREQIGFSPSLIQTVQAVLFSPTKTFSSMKQSGGLASPLLYFVLVSSVMFAVSAAYQMIGPTFNAELLGSQFKGLTKNALTVALIGSILISPALYVVSAFISSGVTHLCLKLLGGAHRPFETTFRVICYAQASASVMNLVPLCGGLIGVIWGAYAIIIGLKEAHGTSGWKATLAITLPGLIVCGVLLMLLAATGFGIAEMSKAGH